MESIPMHLVAIPDGNRRWAKERGLPGPEGHVEGMKKFGEVAKEAFRLGVRYFTFWAASESNLTKRTKEEVAVLMMLFRDEIVRQLHAKEFDEFQARVRVYGKGLEILGDKKVTDAVRDLEERSSKYTDKQLTVLFGYNGTTEMLEAIEQVKSEKLKVTDEILRKHLWTGELPDVDLIIRTGSEGDPHNSAGFMMWLTKDSQFYFTDTCWPDFGKEKLGEALEEYTRRERRLGK
ncbi:MAG: polyprenyl diphosphate synthase [Nanoarchaeota archaeon]|nr:polyprenyl diphosphate synthase [Nanoarchaeota archaeon]